jgi:hypothetical protein
MKADDATRTSWKFQGSKLQTLSNCEAADCNRHPRNFRYRNFNEYELITADNNSKRNRNFVSIQINDFFSSL